MVAPGQGKRRNDGHGHHLSSASGCSSTEHEAAGGSGSMTALPTLPSTRRGTAITTSAGCYLSLPLPWSRPGDEGRDRLDLDAGKVMGAVCSALWIGDRRLPGDQGHGRLTSSSSSPTRRSGRCRARNSWQCPRRTMPRLMNSRHPVRAAHYLYTEITWSKTPFSDWPHLTQV
jgi:hypothetical protein